MKENIAEMAARNGEKLLTPIDDKIIAQRDVNLQEAKTLPETDVKDNEKGIHKTQDDTYGSGNFVFAKQKPTQVKEER